MKKKLQKQIAIICNKQNIIKLKKEWLGIIFILSAIIWGTVLINALLIPDSEIAGAIIIIDTFAFAVIVIFEYFYNEGLSKKLNSLANEKKSLLI